MSDLFIAPSSAQQPFSDWSVEDNITIDQLSAYFQPVNYSIHRSGPNDPAFSYSPDRKYVAFNIESSDLENDEVVSHLRIFDLDSLARFADGGAFPEPVFENIVASTNALPGMGSFQWATDSSALFFLSQQSGHPQLLHWVEGSDAAVPLSESVSGVFYYQLIGSDRVAIFDQLGPSGRLPTPGANSGPFVATGHAIRAVVLGHDRSGRPEASLWPRQMQILNWRSRSIEHEPDAIIHVGAGIGSGGDPLSVSPDGRWIAFAQITHTRSDGRCWRPDPLALDPSDRTYSSRNAVEVIFFDVETGEMRRPFAAPIGRQGNGGYSQVLWSSDSQKAIASNTYTAADQCVAGGGVFPPGAYAYDTDLDRVSPILRYNRDVERGPMTMARRLSWVSDDEVRADFRGWPFVPFDQREIPSTSFFWNGAEWVPGAAPAQLHNDGRTAEPQRHILEVREDYNLPPAIFALSASGESRLLIDLAPHARDRDLVEFEPISWQDEMGVPWTGLLALPPGYTPSDGRLPLLLQTYGFRENRFIAESWTSIVYPGRAMLERGFAVLIVRHPAHILLPFPEEGRAVTRGYQAAIDHLDGMGIVDTERVGTIGWSRKSFHVEYALTQMPDLFAAAVIADGFSKTYTLYLSWVDSEATPRMGISQFEDTYGSDPWPLSEEWINESPGFNTHRVQAPVRIDAPSYRAVLPEWEFYAGLRAQRTPVDMIVYPDGRHALTRPSERRVSTQGSIDWLDFWINGVEDPDPAKADQYERWRGMREERCIWGVQENLPRYCRFH